MALISTFDDWIDLFRAWQKDIDLNLDLVGDYQFEVKFGEASPEIGFGAFAGESKWERVRDIPDQRVRDALLNYIAVQGDTEFASTEQQRHLVHIAPSEYDLKSLVRVMREEMRHGWQMSYLLVTHFGSSGHLEAQKLLQRRAMRGERLLGFFNQPLEDWLDLFVYQKYQLVMLSHSAFAPLARSMGPMLKEESFHLGIGHTGLKRILQAGKVPPAIVQRRFNKWVPACYDLFGTDNSSSAQWGYVWSLKGRYLEGPNAPPLDKEHLNEEARGYYIQECQRLLDDLNRFIPDPSQHLFLPSVRFNRRIGQYANQPYDLQGNLMPLEQFPAYLASVLPTEADKAALAQICKEPDWIAPKGAAGD